jgi:hypothetical protein
MRSPGQSVEEAHHLANDWVKNNISAGISDEKAGHHRAALVHLGEAIHTLQDSTSPAHLGFQEWKGAFIFEDALAHAGKENYDPGRGSSLDRVTRLAWEYFTGKRQLPDDVFEAVNNMLGSTSVEPKP